MARYVITQRGGNPPQAGEIQPRGLCFRSRRLARRAAGVQAQDGTMTTTGTQQQVTPELRRWIVEQAQAGHSAESVLKAMIASGWNEEVAVEALETTLRDHLEGQAHIQGLPSPVPVPDPLLDESPRVHRCGGPAGGGAAVHVQPARRGVRQPAVRRGMRAADRTGQAAAGAIADRGHQDRRRGSQCRPDQQRDVLPAGRERTGAAHRTADRPARELAEGNGEGLQILQYRPGAEYKPHYDYFDPRSPARPPS